MASPSVMKLAKMAESGRRAMANIRNRAKQKERYAIAQAEIIAGGVAAGLIDGTMGEDGAEAELFGLPVTAVVGGLGVAAGFSDLPGADHAGFMGAGVLAYKFGNMARDGVAEG